MPWTEITRSQCRREGLGYASDLTDAEWALLAPLMPRSKHVGRPRKVDLRVVVNAVLYMATTGCQWRMLPKSFPPRSTVQHYFYTWRDIGLLRRMNGALVRRDRVAEGRKPKPTACVIDSQSVRTTESGGPRGFDPAKRVKGRKRHLAVDTGGRPLVMQVHSAEVQDNHGAVPLLKAVAEKFARLRHAFADRVYRGPKLLEAIAETGAWTIEIVTRDKSVGTFVAEPRRWVIERTIAWLNRCRRLAKDYEKTIASAVAWLYVASIRFLSRRLARNRIC